MNSSKFTRMFEASYHIDVCLVSPVRNFLKIIGREAA